MSWSEKCTTARGILDWFVKSLGSAPVNALEPVFAKIAVTPMSVREYWLQLQLHYMLELEFARDTVWRILQRDPPSVSIPIPSQPNGASAEKYYRKWPDLLVVRKGKEYGFYWWELQWIDNPEKLKRFIADASLIGQMAVGETARRYKQEIGGKPGDQLGELVRVLEDLERGDVSGDRLHEIVSTGRHVAIAFGTLTDPNDFRKGRSTEEVIHGWKSDVSKVKSSYPDAFRETVQSHLSAFSKEELQVLALSLAGRQTEVHLDLVAWRHEWKG